VAVGRLRPAFRAACDEYLARIGRYVTIRETEVREAGRAGSPQVQRREEGRAIRAALPPRVVRVALDIDGQTWSSEQLAERMRDWRDGARDLAFVIGGAVGLDDPIRNDADQRWSLGPLTLPHELARVVVVEQLYRAFTILRGEPYHKGADRAG